MTCIWTNVPNGYISDSEEVGECFAHGLLEGLFGLGERAVKVKGDKSDHLDCPLCWL
jgi:hypothetical protein